MEFGLLQMAVAVLMRVPALHIAITREGRYPADMGTLFMLSLFSALLGFFMPAAGILDIGGALFRIVLMSVIIMTLLRTELFDALGIVLVAAIIQSLVILALSISPFNFLVAGMSPLTIP